MKKFILIITFYLLSTSHGRAQLYHQFTTEYNPVYYFNNRPIKLQISADGEAMPSLSYAVFNKAGWGFSLSYKIAQTWYRPWSPGCYPDVLPGLTGKATIIYVANAFKKIRIKKSNFNFTPNLGGGLICAYDYYFLGCVYHQVFSEPHFGGEFTRGPVLTSGFNFEYVLKKRFSAHIGCSYYQRLQNRNQNNILLGQIGLGYIFHKKRK